MGNVGGITSFARCGLFHKGLDNGSMPAKLKDNYLRLIGGEHTQQSSVLTVSVVWLSWECSWSDFCEVRMLNILCWPSQWGCCKFPRSWNLFSRLWIIILNGEWWWPFQGRELTGSCFSQLLVSPKSSTRKVYWQYVHNWGAVVVMVSILLVLFMDMFDQI